VSPKRSLTPAWLLWPTPPYHGLGPSIRVPHRRSRYDRRVAIERVTGRGRSQASTSPWCVAAAGPPDQGEVLGHGAGLEPDQPAGVPQVDHDLVLRRPVIADLGHDRQHVEQCEDNAGRGSLRRMTVAVPNANGAGARTGPGCDCGWSSPGTGTSVAGRLRGFLHHRGGG
jgi:hypothetical protein